MSSLCCSFNVFLNYNISSNRCILYIIIPLPEVYVRVCLLGWDIPGITSYFKVNILDF